MHTLIHQAVSAIAGSEYLRDIVSQILIAPHTSLCSLSFKLLNSATRISSSSACIGQELATNYEVELKT